MRNLYMALNRFPPQPRSRAIATSTNWASFLASTHLSKLKVVGSTVALLESNYNEFFAFDLLGEIRAFSSWCGGVNTAPWEQELIFLKIKQTLKPEIKL